MPIEWRLARDNSKESVNLLSIQINHWLFDLLNSLAWIYHELIFVAKKKRNFHRKSFDQSNRYFTTGFCVNDDWVKNSSIWFRSVARREFHNVFLLYRFKMFFMIYLKQRLHHTSRRVVNNRVHVDDLEDIVWSEKILFLSRISPTIWIRIKLRIAI